MARKLTYLREGRSVKESGYSRYSPFEDFRQYFQDTGYNFSPDALDKLYSHYMDRAPGSLDFPVHDLAKLHLDLAVNDDSATSIEELFSDPDLRRWHLEDDSFGEFFPGIKGHDSFDSWHKATVPDLSELDAKKHFFDLYFSEDSLLEELYDFFVDLGPYHRLVVYYPYD